MQTIDIATGLPRWDLPCGAYALAGSRVNGGGLVIWHGERVLFAGLEAEQVLGEEHPAVQSTHAVTRCEVEAQLQAGRTLASILRAERAMKFDGIYIAPTLGY